MKMKTFDKLLITKLILLIFLAVGSFSFAQKTDTLCADTDKILRMISNDNVKIFTKRCKIPRKLKRALKKELKKRWEWNRHDNGVFRLRLYSHMMMFYIPGRIENPCDAKIFVFGGKTKNYSFIVYIRPGKTGARYHLVFFDNNTSVITLFRPGCVENYEELKSAIRAGEVELDTISYNKKLLYSIYK